MIHFQIGLDCVKGSKPQDSNAGNFAGKRPLRPDSNNQSPTQPPADPLESIPILE